MSFSKSWQFSQFEIFLFNFFVTSDYAIFNKTKKAKYFKIYVQHKLSIVYSIHYLLQSSKKEKKTV